jgi:hypothetical protein
MWDRQVGMKANRVGSRRLRSASMQERRFEINGIPSRLYEVAGPSGLLLFGHRGMLSKDDPGTVSLCRTLAERTRLGVVCIDAPAHGERHPKTGDAEVDARMVVEAVASGAGQMVADWHATADHLAGYGPPRA